ncbi:MAG: hypothetical protein WA602_04355, partial [Silvibacterium sp.]
TREYQTDQSSLKTAPTAARSVLEKRQQQTHRSRRVDTVTPYQGKARFQVRSSSKSTLAIYGQHVIAAVLATYALPLRGKSMPYAQSLPSSTAKNVTIVPGKPKMKANVRQSTLGLFCARMPAKLMLADTHSPEMPVSRT